MTNWCPDVDTGDCYCMECERPCGCPPGPCLQPDHECSPEREVQSERVVTLEQFKKWESDAWLDAGYSGRWSNVNQFIMAYIGARISAYFKEGR